MDWLLLAQLTPTERTQAWQVFINFGVIGIIAFTTLAFIAGFFGLLWVILKRILMKYAPELFEEIMLTFRSVRTSQEGIAENQKGIAESQKLSASNTDKILTLHDKHYTATAELTEFLRKQLGPGPSNANARLEQFCLMSVEMLADVAKQLQDPTVRIEWERHLKAMRDCLTHNK